MCDMLKKIRAMREVYQGLFLYILYILYIIYMPIPFVNEAKYLGMNLDVRLKWEAHMKKTQDELEIIRNLSWFIGRRSQIAIDNKLLNINKS
jgi:hypothetical protein